MSDFFYTNVIEHRGKIYFRGYKGNEQIIGKEDFSPTVYIKDSNQSSDWRSIHDEPLTEKTFGTIKELQAFTESFGEVMEIHGMSRRSDQAYAWINKHTADEVKFNRDNIKILIFDIETESAGGFPNVWEDPFQPVNAITAYADDLGYVTWGLRNSYVDEDLEYDYRRFDTEEELLHDFFKFIAHEKPDILSGWNIDGFDVPYLINRVKMYYNPAWVTLLSPWKLQPNEVTQKSGDKTYEIPGITSYDYLAVYKKFELSPRESYSLDAIASLELGERKLDYSEYDSMHDLYKNDWQKFIEYNKRDVTLVKKLDDKKKFFDLALTYAYLAKVNLSDVFGTVKYWDVYIYNHLQKKKIAVPPESMSSSHSYPGGYVKDPQAGMHEWVASFDLNSLYPNVIVEWNISPDTILDVEPHPSYAEEKWDIINSILEEKYDNSSLLRDDVTMAGNGQYFRRDKQGFIPEMVERGYAMRKEYKKKMKAMELEYEKTKDPVLLVEAQRFESIQYALKIQLNSLYGALGTKYFRYYDVRMAEAVTCTGRTVIKWTERNVNTYLNKLLGNKEFKDYIIAIDTDSVFVAMSDLLSKVFKGNIPEVAKTIDVMDKLSKDKLVPLMANGYEKLHTYLNTYKPRMVIEREVLGDKGIWLAKKKYVINIWDNEGVRYSDPHFKIRGIEIVRTSTPEVCRDSIKQAVRVIFDEGEKGIQEYIANFRKEFDSLSYDAISFPRGVSSIDKWLDPVTKYKKGTPIHVRAVILYNEMLAKVKSDKYEVIREGEKIKFAYLKMPNPLHENVIGYSKFIPEEFGLREFIDYDLQFEKAFLSPIKSILDAIGWSVKEEVNLDDLFS